MAKFVSIPFLTKRLKLFWRLIVMSINAKKVADLEKIARKLRYHIVMMIGAGKPGHLGAHVLLLI